MGKAIRKGAMVSVEWGVFGIIKARVEKKTGEFFVAYMPFKYSGEVHYEKVAVACSEVVSVA